MRRFAGLPLRQIRARRLRALLTTIGIVLGVGMIFGVLVLSATILNTFESLYDSVYGRTDLVVSGKQSTGSLREGTLRKVRRTEGVDEVSPNVFSVLSLVDRRGRAGREPEADVNVVGVDPDAPDLTDSRITRGREIEGGREIQLQESWAESQGIALGDSVRLATPAGVRAFEVVGLFQFATGLEFGGEGFGAIPLGTARRAFDKHDTYDEINVIVAGGPGEIDDVRGRLRQALGRGVDVKTPESKSEEIQDQIQAFNVILYFFAGMALFVGGFLIFNSFNMTVLQRTRELGMLRTLGATRAMIARSVLLEAAMLGVVGTAIGLALGIGLARLLVLLMQELGFPVGGLEVTATAAAVAVVAGLVTTVAGSLLPARRAARVSPVRAVLGQGEARDRPRPRRAAVGAVMILLGMAGAWWLGAADDTTAAVALAGMGGVIAIFFGIAMLVPFAVSPLSRGLSWPMRRAFPIEGRLAADTTRSNPGRTAATSMGVLIGLSLVVAFGALTSSFLGSISDEFDRSFARDFTVQPRGFSPGEGPQQAIAEGLRDRILDLPEASVVARERVLYLPELPRDHGDGLLLGFDPEEYEKVDSTDIVGAPREEVFRRLARGEVTAGKGYADEEDVAVGDRLTLSGPSGRRRARVAGIVKTVIFGGETLGMSLETMREVYGVTNDSQLAIKARSDGDRPRLKRRIERILERDHPNLVVLSNDDLKADIEDRLRQQTGFFNAIVGMAVLVSLFGIVNTLSMSVFERTREIGVLRALGASRWQVRRSIADESLLISLIGTVLGIGVGLGLGWALMQGLAAGIPNVTYSPPVGTVVGVGIAGVFLGLVASILPARRAARLDVVQALSYE